MKKVLITLAFAGLAGSVFSQIDSNTINSSDNSTVQPGGPRTGVNGKRFLNIEGSSFGNFASYAVVDFNAGLLSFGQAFEDVTSLKVDFRQSNAAFTASGALRFFLTGDTSTSIQPGGGLFFDASQSPNGLGSQLSPTYLLGAATFTKVANGQVDSYTFAVSGSASTLLSDAVRNASTVRLIVTPDDATVAATWGGGDNNNGIPSLTLTASTAPVPEPATLAVVGAGLAAMLRRRRRS